MKSFLSIKSAFILFFVVLTALTNTANSQGCSNKIVAACSHIVCSYTGVSNNVYTPYIFVHEDGTPGTTFKTNETIYHYATQNLFSCVSPMSTTAIYRTVNLPTSATLICGPTNVSSYFACVIDQNGDLVKSSKTCQKLGTIQYISAKVTQFKFTTAGTYNMTFNNGNGSTVTLTIDDNADAPPTPYVSIASDKGTTVAPNTSVTYTLSTNITTANAAITWRKNGTTVQTFGTTYTTSTLANNDNITCQVAFDCGFDLSKSPMTSNTITMTVSSVMPVELKSFDGKAMKDGNLLTWNTASETKNKGFALERQLPNSKEWEDIMLFVGKNKASTYQYLDETAPYLSYYRLRQIDADGSTTYSKIISVERSGSLKGFGLSIYPNPVSDVLTIEADDTNADYQVINLLGQTVLRGTASTQINVSAVPQGSYVLKIGAEQVKFIKQ
jgi:hypothetical protein